MTNRVAINGEAATEVEERVRTRMDQEDQNTPEESREDQESPDTKGLHLLNYWYPICFVRDLPTAKPLAAQLFGEPLVIFRGAAQELVCLQDRCAHRSAPLSIGTLKKGVVECRYHGWQFGAEGKCVRIPSLPDDKIPKSVRITSYPCTEREGIVWVWLGEAEKCSLVSGFPEIAAEWRAPGWRTTDMPLDQEYSYWALIENLLDPGHLQFTHEGTQGKNVGSTDDSFPDLHEVVITSTRNQGGFQGEIHSTSTKKELRFKIIFDPPVTVRLEVVFPNGWLFFQMHYCVPLTEGRTRILLRSMRTWLKFLPDFAFHKSNLRILDQDKCILYAQKLRSDQGSSSWNYPTKADALAIRYRRWRDVVEPRSKPWFKGYLGSSLKKGGGVRRGALGTGKDEKKEIEDLPKCCGACDQNLQTIDDIWKEAPYLWPSSEVLKQPPGAFEILTAVGKVLYVGCQIFALAVTILYLSDRFSHD